MRFPAVLWTLIKTYAKDMELLEQTPEIGINLINLGFPLSIPKFYTEQYYQLMVSNLQNVDLESYVNEFLDFPLDVFYRYMRAQVIWRQRCDLWELSETNMRECSVIDLVQSCFMDHNPFQLRRSLRSPPRGNPPPLL